MSYKTIDGLMRHLRDNGIAISGSKQKQMLVNTGYFHGYKGYRFFKQSNQRIPFTSFDEIYATIEFDSQLKALFYPKVMFIETAVKNITLECILNRVKSENIQVICEKALCSYHNAPPTASERERKIYQQTNLNIQNTIYSYLAKNYQSDNPKITHFYNHTRGYNDVPFWALLEIMTLGDIGHFLSGLTYQVRLDISNRLNLNHSVDTNCELIYKYVYFIKDFRNAIAHNDVIFDTRFRKFDPSVPMKRCIEFEFALPYVNFKTIGDYLLLIVYFLKSLGVTKTEIKGFIRDFEGIVAKYKSSVSPAVSAIVIHPDLASRLSILKQHM